MCQFMDGGMPIHRWAVHIREWAGGTAMNYYATNTVLYLLLLSPVMIDTLEIVAVAR